MIDKSGNGDTYSELLSGSGWTEMKSDGLSYGRRVTAARTQAVGAGGWLISATDGGMTTRRMTAAPLCLGDK